MFTLPSWFVPFCLGCIYTYIMVVLCVLWYQRKDRDKPTSYNLACPEEKVAFRALLLEQEGIYEV